MACHRIVRGIRLRLRECNQSAHRATTTSFSRAHSRADIAATAGTGSRFRSRTGGSRDAATVVSAAAANANL